MSATVAVAYLALFASVGAVFLFVNLLVGKFLRPVEPNPEKLAVYECGEPTIGSSFVQFDLRFYVVALLFIIFDVEVAFFFPWATVFGKCTHLMDPDLTKIERRTGELTPATANVYKELGVPDPTPATVGTSARQIEDSARNLAWISVLDILVFFAVLMVGFAYVWRRGDLDWVRAVSRQRAIRGNTRPPSRVEEEEPALVG
ncbi:MAG TPA: NADH-quinone oxidoreductase subunit A [Pirellulales bacterium]|nr:NADH-quinone oxidoreductase subunit A [Pirellulales bacterium]